MSQRVRGIVEEIDSLGERLANAVKEEFPIGARVSYMRSGNNRTGVIKDYIGFHDTIGLRVLADRTQQLVDVRLHEQPEVILHAAAR